MYEILLWQLKLVSTIFIFAIKIKFLKNYQKMLLVLPKRILLSSRLFFPFLAIAVFIEEVD